MPERERDRSVGLSFTLGVWMIQSVGEKFAVIEMSLSLSLSLVSLACQRDSGVSSAMESVGEKVPAMAVSISIMLFVSAAYTFLYSYPY